MSEQEKPNDNKFLLFIEDFDTFSVIKKIIYLLPITVLWIVLISFYGLDDFDSLLWLIPFIVPIFTSFYLIKLIWFNLILGRIETVKTKSIISIIFMILMLGGFEGFDDVFKLYGKNDLVNIIDLIYYCIMMLSSVYLVHYVFLHLFSEDKYEVLRKLWFNDRYKNK
jgi:hypothetical protein